MFARVKKSGLYQYLQLVENRKEGPKTMQRVVATVGRLDKLRKEGRMESLLQSMTRFSKNAILLMSNARKDPKSRIFKIGPPLIFERLWHRTGIRDVLKDLLGKRKFEFDVERAIFLTVLNRLLAPGSDRWTQRWREKYQIEGCKNLSLHHLYRAMAWLGEILPKNQQDSATPFAPRCVKDVIEEGLFGRRRDLFAELDFVFFDTTSLYFEGCGGETLGQLGKSKDHRSDLNQMILGVVLDGQGKPICSEMWPGNVTDVKTLIPIIDRLRSRFGIGRICVVSDRGMISADTIRCLESKEYNLDYILGVRMRNQKEVKEDVIKNLDIDSFEVVYPARCKTKDPSPLKIKEVYAMDHRYIVCFNEEQARRDAHKREAIIESLGEKIKSGATALIGNKGYRKYLSICKKSFNIDADKIAADVQYDGLWVLRTNTKLSAAETALKYKELWRVERVFRDTKSLLNTRPVFHKYDETIRGHVFCSFLALVIREELESELENAGYIYEWSDIKRDLKALEETEINHDGKSLLIRNECQGNCGKIFQAVGVALPPTIRKK